MSCCNLARSGDDMAKVTSSSSSDSYTAGVDGRLGWSRSGDELLCRGREVLGVNLGSLIAWRFQVPTRNKVSRGVRNQLPKSCLIYLPPIPNAHSSILSFLFLESVRIATLHQPGCTSECTLASQHPWVWLSASLSTMEVALLSPRGTTFQLAR